MKDFKRLEIEDWLRIFLRRKWSFIFTTIVVAGGMGYYAYKSPEFYRSQTKILVNFASIPADYVGTSEPGTMAERMNTIREHVRSRNNLQKLIQDYGLLRYGQSGFDMEGTTFLLQTRIQVATPLDTRTIILSFLHENPSDAQSVTRRLAEELVSWNKTTRKNRAEGTDVFVEQQLSQTERDLNAQEEKIKQFKADNLAYLPEQSVANITALNGLQTQLAAANNLLQQAKDHRRLLEFRLEEQKRINNMARDLFPSESSPTAANEPRPRDPVVANAQLANKRAQLADLSTRYTPTHPDIQKLTREIQELERQQAAARSTEVQAAVKNELTPLGQTGKAVEQAKSTVEAGTSFFDLESAEIKYEMEKADNEVSKREKDIADIQQQIKVVGGRLGQAPTLEQKLAGLLREQNLLRQQWDSLQAKKFNSRMAANLESDSENQTLEIIDEANLPGAPVFPNRWQIFLVGLGASLFLGFAVVLMREYLDPTLGNEREAAAVLNVPVLASIPEVSIEGMPVRKRIPRSASAA